MNLMMIFKVALLAISRNKTRSLLTCLGIIVGIAAVIAVLAIGLSVGANILAARAYGANDYEKLHRTVHTSMLVAVVCGIFLAVFGVTFGRDILRRRRRVSHR